MPSEGRAVRFEWVKGHAGHDLNEEADRLANGASLAYSQGRQPDPGPGFGGVRDRSDPHAGYSPTEPPAPEADLFSLIAEDVTDCVTDGVDDGVDDGVGRRRGRPGSR